MNKKRGVTTAVIILAVVIMFIILTTATVVGSRNINTVNYEEYMSQLNRVSDSVNAYILANDEMPVRDSYEIVANAGLTEDFKNELIENGDMTEDGDMNNNLYVIDMNKLDVNNVSKGKGTVQDRDVFLVAENSNNIYYYKGYLFRGTVYYGV